MSEKVNSVIDQQIKFHRRFFLIRSPKLRRTDRAFVFIETRVQFCQNVISDLVTFTAVIQPLTLKAAFVSTTILTIRYVYQYFLSIQVLRFVCSTLFIIAIDVFIGINWY